MRGGRSFGDPELEQVIRTCPGVPEGIDIEITESVFVKDLAGSIARLNAARKLGLRVSIDDFGTGYSSLSYLSRLPIDALKIDRSFVTGMGTSPQEASIVMTIISLAHAMDLKVIAEGVETYWQAQLLRLLKCDQIQGYLISKPVPAQQIQQLFAKQFSFSETPSTASSEAGAESHVRLQAAFSQSSQPEPGRESSRKSARTGA